MDTYAIRIKIQNLAYDLREAGFSVDDVEEFFITLIDDMKEEEEEEEEEEE